MSASSGPVRPPGTLKLIGLLGGVASGKSLVARLLAECGAGVLDADQAGHEVLRLPWVEEQIRQRWGAAACDAAGRIDRAKLARLVFAPPPHGPLNRTYLEQITHPEIARLLDEQAARLAAAGTEVAVLDVPLLLETGWDKRCDWLVFVAAPPQTRQQRARERGWNSEQFAAREAAQSDLDNKLARAHVVIDNSGTPEQTRRQVEHWWRTVVQNRSAKPDQEKPE